MRIQIPGYRGTHRILSIAIDERTGHDLYSEGVDFLYVSHGKAYIYPDGMLLTADQNTVDCFAACNNYDVFELYEDGTAYRCYDDSSVENVFFITDKCNSNCIICPMPESSRKRGNMANIDNLIEIARHIPSDVSHMTITGGEPFMVGKELFRLLAFCKEKFEETEFQILTNGRAFAMDDYCEYLLATIPNHSIIGIPIHGSCQKIHDAITQAPGSFRQTIAGLRKIQELGIVTELRVVVCRDNVFDLKNMAEMIASEFQKTSFVSIMAMEMTGSAYMNRERVWIPYKESFRYVRQAVDVLINAGIDVRLYNFPLCTVDSDMRMICFKSISSWKVRYGQECSGCSVKNVCGGVFAGTFQLEHKELIPIL